MGKRITVPPVETAQLLHAETLIAMGRYAQAVSETRLLTYQGDSSAPEVLVVSLIIIFRNSLSVSLG